MPFLSTNGQRIHYQDTGGEGLPLVLGHGFLMDHEMFAPQVAALRDRHRVIAWDERGHGATATTPTDFSYWDSAEDLRGILDHLGIERAVVGGMSQGGFLSLRFALRHPDRVAGLVLIDTQSGPESPDKVTQYDVLADVWTSQGLSDVMAEAVATIILGADRAEWPRWIEKWRARPPESLGQIYRTLVTRDDITDRLPQVGAPAIVIHGEEDLAIEIEHAERLAEGLPDVRAFVRVPGAGHAANLTHPDPVNAAIAGFLPALS